MDFIKKFGFKVVLGHPGVSERIDGFGVVNER